jgi:hypothetical protein
MKRADHPPDIFFLAFMLLGVAYAIWILPETRNVGLEAMDKVFNSNDATRDADKMTRIIERLQVEYGYKAGSGRSSHHSEKGEIHEVDSV